MQKVLLFSHSGFSDENANGITMKNLLSAWPAKEKAEFYCDVQPPDYSAAHQYFRVTDVQTMKAFLGRKSEHIFTYDPARQELKTVSPSPRSPKKIPGWLKKQKYNFSLRLLREHMKSISPWGHRSFWRWLEEVRPDVIVYMVGESFFQDKLVLKAQKKTGVPLVLYNGEAFRIIELKKRHGLERAYYRKVEKLYEKLNERASLTIYNCSMLMEDYQRRYPVVGKAMIAYNSAAAQPDYVPGDDLKITYFGNLGVGRSDVLLHAADILGQIQTDLKIHIYGNATAENAQRFDGHPNIDYHGFVDQTQLQTVIRESDILLHVESFDPDIIPKLRYAFSTKIAQCLRAGRCFVTYAPSQTASTQYLAASGGAAVASSSQMFKTLMEQLVADPDARLSWARKAAAVGAENHHMENTAALVRRQIEALEGDRA